MIPRLLLLFLVLMLGGCIRPALPLIVNNAVITGNVVWQGTVRVRGVVTVKKEGRLTLLPGTRVAFERVDRDGDGVGDSELLVEGELQAQGTAARPIVLTSAAAHPKPADWKYLGLEFARNADIEHLVSEYAYSGIQVHFCKARVLDSVFRHNVDGVRFSTVNIEVAGNRIYDNVNGLRYEERHSKANIHHNEIRDNQVGIFVVTRSANRARIEYNNITGSRRYAVKLGLGQHSDVTLPHNWWGDADPKRIAATFLDQQTDPQLGRVRIPEPLPGPVRIEGWTTQAGGSP